MSIAILSAYASHSQTLAIHFRFNKYKLDEKAMMLIDSFFIAEKDKLATGVIELSGHCDNIGSDAYNDALSGRRVGTVKKYIESNDYLTPGKIVMATGYGERKPLNDNKTGEDRRLNRRVEISIVQPGEAGSNSENQISLQQKIADSATKAGTKITLRNINFLGGRHQFLPEAYPVLEELLATLKMYPRLVIEIRGHICCQQNDGDGLDADTREYNLSEERAKAVYDYLITNGIDAKRLSYHGYGHSLPIYPYPEQSEEERVENRRVEIRVLSK